MTQCPACSSDDIDEAQLTKQTHDGKTIVVGTEWYCDECGHWEQERDDTP